MIHIYIYMDSAEAAGSGRPTCASWKSGDEKAASRFSSGEREDESGFVKSSGKDANCSDISSRLSSSKSSKDSCTGFRIISPLQQPLLPGGQSLVVLFRVNKEQKEKNSAIDMAISNGHGTTSHRHGTTNHRHGTKSYRHGTTSRAETNSRYYTWG